MIVVWNINYLKIGTLIPTVMKRYQQFGTWYTCNMSPTRIIYKKNDSSSSLFSKKKEKITTRLPELNSIKSSEDLLSLKISNTNHVAHIWTPCNCCWRCISFFFKRCTHNGKNKLFHTYHLCRFLWWWQRRLLEGVNLRLFSFFFDSCFGRNFKVIELKLLWRFDNGIGWNLRFTFFVIWG